MSQNPITGKEESVGSDSSIGPRVARGTARYTYNFGVQPSAIGTYVLPGPILPDNAVIKDAFIDVLTVPTSGGSATIGLGFETTSDINDEDAISGAPWSSAGVVDTDAPTHGTESGYVKLTGNKGLQMIIGTAALTAGIFTVIVEYDVTG